jgi:hypothetical protein
MRQIFKTLVGLVATALIIPFIQAPAAKLAETVGFDKQLSSRWHPLVDFLVSLQHSAAYIFVAGLLSGVSFGVGLDVFLRKYRTSGRDSDAVFQETMLRIERDRSVPHQWSPTVKRNVFVCFQIYNFKPMVVFKEFGFAKADVTFPELFPAVPDQNMPTPEQIDTFFIVLEKPIIYSSVKIESFGQIFPKHDIYCNTPRTIILYFREPFPDKMTSFELHFMP